NATTTLRPDLRGRREELNPRSWKAAPSAPKSLPWPPFAAHEAGHGGPQGESAKPWPPGGGTPKRCFCRNSLPQNVGVILGAGLEWPRRGRALRDEVRARLSRRRLPAACESAAHR